MKNATLGKTGRLKMLLWSYFFESSKCYFGQNFKGSKVAKCYFGPKCEKYKIAMTMVSTTLLVVHLRLQRYADQYFHSQKAANNLNCLQKSWIAIHYANCRYLPCSYTIYITHTCPQFENQCVRRKAHAYTPRMPSEITIRRSIIAR